MGNARNGNFGRARTRKADEFYTRMDTIEKELSYYPDFFLNKTVYLPCDDPETSMFFRYFVLNFRRLGLKKLYASRWSGPMDMCLSFDYPRAMLFTVTEIPDALPADFSMEDFLQEPCVDKKPLYGNGDMFSNECIHILSDSDIVVTNPPFSLFRKYSLLLLEQGKDFLMLGTAISATYKQLFPYIKNRKVTFGPSITAGDVRFTVPDTYDMNASTCGTDRVGPYIHVSGIRWFTTLSTPVPCPLELTASYTEGAYPRRDFDGCINVDSTEAIPKDYTGIMAVPITFLDKWNPKQFDVLDYSNRYFVFDIFGLNEEIRKKHSHSTVIDGKPRFGRLLIKRKD